MTDGMLFSTIDDLVSLAHFRLEGLLSQWLT